MTFEIDSPKYGKHIVFIDDEDWPKVRDYTWRVSFRKRSGRIEPQNVRTHIRTKDGKYTSLYLHRLILPRCKIVDHIDCNVLNNRKSNLRESTESENMRNKRVYKNNKLKIKGVHFNSKTNKFRAQINVNKKHFSLGEFDNITDAASAYNKAALKYHGEFARLNEI